MKERKRWWDRENYIIRNFTNSTLRQILYVFQTKERSMGRTSSTNRNCEESKHDF
jgi:hypothetical protein